MDTVVYIWVGMALIGMLISHARGHGYLAGFLWSILLGPIGWLVILAVRPKPKPA